MERLLSGEMVTMPIVWFALCYCASFSVVEFYLLNLEQSYSLGHVELELTL